MSELRCRISPEQEEQLSKVTSLVDEARAALRAAELQAGLVVGTILRGYGVKKGCMLHIEATVDGPVMVAEVDGEEPGGPHPEWTAGWESRDESVPGDIGEAVEAALS